LLRNDKRGSGILVAVIALSGDAIRRSMINCSKRATRSG
jgi:hypothetical protein